MCICDFVKAADIEVRILSKGYFCDHMRQGHIHTVILKKALDSTYVEMFDGASRTEACSKAESYLKTKK